ncbi:MAG: tRNA pseudouridine(38-40) synthase TruA [Alistipes sp.]|jgi:tRNA pseudouridine38-40 synthase|nr:tRNA pseudouridine(38-40) synthase TruA [Alistipes sp.]
MRYFLELSYNGTAYCGWQRQPDAPSVQQTIEEALTTLLTKRGKSGEKSETIELTGAGRTDTGVHAAHYVAHFDIPDTPNTPNTSGISGISDALGTSDAQRLIANEADFLYHANSILPPDIALHRVRRVADDAHARFDAREREYTYYIVPFKDPFRNATAWQYTVPLDIAAMNRAAACLLTTTDFTTFAKLGGGNHTNICRVTVAKWESVSDGTLTFTIRADRFLRNMVRAVVGTLVDVGRGKLTPERFAEIVAARDLSLSSGGAPARGLFLTDIKY